MPLYEIRYKHNDSYTIHEQLDHIGGRTVKVAARNAPRGWEQFPDLSVAYVKKPDLRAALRTAYALANPSAR